MCGTRRRVERVGAVSAFERLAQLDAKVADTVVAAAATEDRQQGKRKKASKGFHAKHKQHLMW